jgi:hypothetical protein
MTLAVVIPAVGIMVGLLVWNESRDDMRIWRDMRAERKAARQWKKITGDQSAGIDAHARTWGLFALIR